MTFSITKRNITSFDADNVWRDTIPVAAITILDIH